MNLLLLTAQVELVCGCEDGFVYIINLETDKIEMKFSV
jgi:hypothetical protein